VFTCDFCCARRSAALPRRLGGKKGEDVSLVHPVGCFGGFIMSFRMIHAVLLIAGIWINVPVIAENVDGSDGKILARFAVDSGKSERLNTPVSVEYSGDVYGLRLVELCEGKRVPVPFQMEKSGNGTNLCWVLTGKTPPEVKRVYGLEKGTAEEVGGIVVKDDGSSLEILCSNKTVLRYKYGVEPAPEGADVKYAKSGFIHPVCSPAGQVLTQIHPADHIHHMGLWNAWTSTKFEGRKVDFWNIKEGKGTVRFAKCLEKTGGPVFGGFKVVQEHVDLSAPDGAKGALNEVLEVKVWNIGKDAWLFDLVSIQTCASQSPLTLLKYRYGGFGYRATPEWGNDNSDYLTSEGKTRKDGNGSTARWAVMQGKTNKGEAGLMMMTDVRNLNYPEPIRIWDAKQQNGCMFFNFCPIQQKEIVLEPGKEYVSRYRVCVFDGQMNKEGAERLWSDMAHPPKALK